MGAKITIRIVEKDANRRGDLFGRLMADLFVALGYEQPRLNIHKSGRELDLSANHRLEPRRAIGECKATTDPIGGDDLNKFVGALDAEYNNETPITGYFISLAGFKETAIEQENQRRRTKVILLNGSKVIDELVNGRILIERNRATELAGRCCGDHNNIALDPEAELLAHERGWIWSIYYTQGKMRTHFALIHSDGTPLSRTLANEVIAHDRDSGGILDALVCLNPEPLPGSDKDPHVAEALAAYSHYIANECGYIQLDGLPADSDVGSRRLKLENLFVPLHLDTNNRKETRQPIGKILKDTPRLAILAAPGGGKSTLIKRLAVAYSDPARHSRIADKLPQKDWFPLFFRCRELRSSARCSFAELIDALSQREPVRQYASTFRAYVDRALMAGRILLLIDGLDEISDSGDRAAFVCTLRTALQAYPNTAIVVTSREAGFRHVAAHLAPICTQTTLSSFDEVDIERLSVAWHREVIGDTQKVRVDAEQLAATITRNDRINRLAINPLLLTTLLLVKRWVGSLPTRRAILYGKAVEVLLMTWNTEGHEPIPEEEAMPQLCYVASSMMLEGVERVSRPRLAALLQEARAALPTELGYVKGTVEDFIHRVEDRSSLLMMTGHDVEDGRLVEFFEFRHLTFQEFLSARAMVEGWHPGRKDDENLVAVLKPRFDEDKWREIIPLAAVLGGKASEALIQCLTQLVNAMDLEHLKMNDKANIFIALGNCLADEVAARPDTIRSAIGALIRLGLGEWNWSFVPMLVRGRYASELRDEIERLFLSDHLSNRSYVNAFMHMVWWRSKENDERTDINSLARNFLRFLRSSVRLERCEGALGCVRLMNRCREIGKVLSIDILNEIGDALIPLLFDKNHPEQYSAGLALYELGRYNIWIPPKHPDVIGRMFFLWQHSPSLAIRDRLSLTIASQRLVLYNEEGYCASIERKEFADLIARYDRLGEYSEKPSVLIIAWYLHAFCNLDIVRKARRLLTINANESISSRLNRLITYLDPE